jgi:type IV pilus assembly protein PilA
VRGPFFWWGRLRLKRTTRAQRGIAALELALVVAATLIIGALGVSTYRTHAVRSEIAASVVEAAPAQRLVAAAFEWKGVPPLDSTAAGIDASSRGFLAGTYVETLDVHNGRIDLRFGTRANAAISGKTLSLTPFETVDRQVIWICGNEVPGVGLNPLGFAAGGPLPVQTLTSIEARYLPPACR